MDTSRGDRPWHWEIFGFQSTKCKKQPWSICRSRVKSLFGSGQEKGVLWACHAATTPVAREREKLPRRLGRGQEASFIFFFFLATLGQGGGVASFLAFLRITSWLLRSGRSCPPHVPSLFSVPLPRLPACLGHTHGHTDSGTEGLSRPCRGLAAPPGVCRPRCPRVCPRGGPSTFRSGRREQRLPGTRDTASGLPSSRQMPWDRQSRRRFARGAQEGGGGGEERHRCASASPELAPNLFPRRHLRAVRVRWAALGTADGPSSPAPKNGTPAIRQAKRPATSVFRSRVSL